MSTRRRPRPPAAPRAGPTRAAAPSSAGPATTASAHVGLTVLGARARTALNRRPDSRRGGFRMDLNYTPEDVAFRKSVRAWLETSLPRAPLRTLDERRAWHRKLYEA